ncbi:unnamed protein product [Adineta steineri]|uniref:Uncharacterized protein n=1 Tax=Adineta steineri TaxID=433720 RepID=A0A818U3N1_9BILA|nr:unnamed protein product [Adineta steineri]
MTELHSIILQNSDENNDSTIRRVLVNIENLIEMLGNEVDQNKSSISPNLMNYSSTTTITSVTISDDDNNHRLIEHLRHRIIRLEHERNVLLTSYQLLIKLLK